MLKSHTLKKLEVRDGTTTCEILNILIIDRGEYNAVNTCNGAFSKAVSIFTISQSTLDGYFLIRSRRPKLQLSFGLLQSEFYPTSERP